MDGGLVSNSSRQFLTKVLLRVLQIHIGQSLVRYCASCFPLVYPGRRRERQFSAVGYLLVFRDFLTDPRGATVVLSQGRSSCRPLLPMSTFSIGWQGALATWSLGGSVKIDKTLYRIRVLEGGFLLSHYFEILVGTLHGDYKNALAKCWGWPWSLRSDSSRRRWSDVVKTIKYSPCLHYRTCARMN